MPRTLLLLPVLLAVACSSPRSSAQDSHGQSGGGTLRADDPPANRAVAVFAGGCFWCMEGPFEALEGVEEVLSGYTGGEIAAPSYGAVSSGQTGHAEAVRVLYDPTRISYQQLLDVFWVNVDPTQADGQFCDHGTQYRTGIFVANADERRLAEASRRAAAQRLGRRVVTEITDAGPFWIAEDYHQDFHRTNPVRYRLYRTGCGRDARLRQLWGDDAAH